MAHLPHDSQITPALWFFTSSTLWLLLLIRLFKAEVKTTLGILEFRPIWALNAVIIGLGFWWFDHLLNSMVFSTDINAQIIQWRLANLNYADSSVLLSSVIFAPVFEEFVFRGLLFRKMNESFNFWLAAGLSALLFALIHWSWPAFFSLFVIGLIYAWITVRSGSVVPALLAHIIHNGMTYWVYTQSVIT